MTMMPCARWQEAVSAQLDGEDGGIDPPLVERHLAGCAVCRQFRADAEQLRRLARVRPAMAVPDLSRGIAKAARTSNASASWLYVRLALAIVALQIVVLAVPEVWRVADGHEARHVFSFSVTYALALWLVAWRPARARTVLPISAAFTVALAVTAVTDVARGSTAFLGEFVHVPEFVSVVLVWWLARPQRWAGTSGRSGMRLVTADDHASPDASNTA